MGLDGLRTTVFKIHQDNFILIREGTASVTMTIETLQAIEDVGAEPIFFHCLDLERTAVYQLHYARRSVHGPTKPELSSVRLQIFQPSYLIISPKPPFIQ